MADALTPQALDKLKGARKLLKEALASARDEEWDRSCSNFSRLLRDWRLGRISRDWLPHLDSGPRCFSIEEKIINEALTKKVVKKEDYNSMLDCGCVNELADCLKHLIELEELHIAITMSKHEYESGRLFRDSNRPLQPEDRANKWFHYGIQLSNLVTKLPEIVCGDFVIIKPHAREDIAARIIDIFQIRSKTCIILSKSFPENERLELATPIKVSFVPANISLGYCQKAVEQLRTSETMQKLAFEDEEVLSLSAKKINLARTSNEELEERLGRLDANQRQALVGILEAECRPRAYILDGLLGTGKTRTLIEAIVQVHKRARIGGDQGNISGTSNKRRRVEAPLPKVEVVGRDSESDISMSEDCDSDIEESDLEVCAMKILVCSESEDSSPARRSEIQLSDNCLDVIYKKIKQELPLARVGRFFAAKFDRRVENLDIILTTAIESGGIPDDYKFDYIFIDDAHQASLAETLIPARLLKKDGCLVLAGDLGQLGPVVLCKEARDLEVSMLEWLCLFDNYKFDPDSKTCDGRYMTMLRDCHRCDKRIYSAYKKMFCNSELRCASGTVTPRGLLELLQLTGPFQMRHVNGEQARVLGSDSMYNQAEIEACIDIVWRLYLMGIEPSQIGVTSPFELQIERMRAAFQEAIEGTAKSTSGKHPTLESIVRTRFVAPESSPSLETFRNLECKVDPIGAFQGCEREIMIISTVCSVPEQFKSDPSLLGSAIIRAKWLLIIVGHRDLLERGPLWMWLKDAKTETERWPDEIAYADPFEQSSLFFAS